MKRLFTALLTLACLSFCAVPCFAQTCDEFVVDDADRPEGDSAFAALLAGKAKRATDAGCFEQADRLLEGAHRLSGEPRLVYERVLVLESMGEQVYALELLDAYRRELASDASVTDLEAVEARLRAAARASGHVIDPPSEGVPARRSTLDSVGPIVLGVLGIASLGMAVYGMTANCEQLATEGTCLRGSKPVVGLTVGYATAGVIAFTTAAAWWIIAIPAPLPDAEISLSGLRLRF